jgi:hypothetical protein
MYRFGPPQLVGLPGAAFTDANLLQAGGIVLTWGYATRCSVPIVVHVQVQMPTLNVFSNCTDYQTHSYTGELVLDQR